MRLILNAISLAPDAASSLKAILAPGLSNRSADALIAHALDLGAAFAVLEEPYTDQDYSADYRAFYSGAFKSYPRSTRRLHLFISDPAAVLEGDFAAQAETLAKCGYLGFVVVRPLAQGPIGRTVLPFPQLKGLTVRPAARAEFAAHVIGAQLKVTGAPFIQQENKVGACAQAAIWMASLAVHRRHRRTAWHSMAEITRLASTPTDPALSQALPAGSNGLNPAHMIRALAGMGHQPLFDLFEPNGEGDEAINQEAAPRVLRYLTSAARYRFHLSQSDASPAVKKHLLSRELPHYVWVTELISRDAEQVGLHGPRRVLGHLVTNATSASDPDNDLLVAHTPHVVIHRELLEEPDERGQEYRQTASFVVDGKLYRGRART